MALVLYSAAAINVEELKRLPTRDFRLGDDFIRITQGWRGDGKGGTKLGFGASVYDAAYVLADYIYSYPQCIREKRVVELGCGVGLVAIAASMKGAREVIATDGDSELLSTLTEQNIESNVPQDLQGAIRTAPLLWGNHEQETALSPPFDVVLVADCAACVYEDALSALVDSLQRMCHSDSTVYLSYHQRHASERKFFVRLSRYFSVSQIPREHLHRDFRQQNTISLYRAELKGPKLSPPRPPPVAEEE